MLAARDVWAQPPGATEPAVRGVSFELARGEWLAVTGPNGSGKTTLALVAAGLWPACRGRVEIDGEPLAPTAAGRARAGIAAVLQEPAAQLFERSVADEVVFAARNLGVSGDALHARVREWSERLGLDGLLERDPHELSAGWQQRVLIAAALASQPSVLVADEAAAHLDAAARTRVLAVLREQVERGLAVLWVTQEETESAAADRILNLGADARRPAAEGELTGAWAGPPATPGRLRVRIEPAAGTGPRVNTREPVEFELAAGHPVALVGTNASGKTVALEAIAGVRKCSQVRVEPDGIWRGGATAVWSPILAAQYPELQVFGETVEEELRFGAGQRGADADVALEVAAQVLVELGLDRGMLSRSTWSLSTGERRLVQVTSALVTPASAILVDEPTCGLDPMRARRLGLILGRVAQRVPLGVASQDPYLTALIGAEEVRLGQSPRKSQLQAEKRIDR